MCTEMLPKLQPDSPPHLKLPTTPNPHKSRGPGKCYWPHGKGHSTPISSPHICHSLCLLAVPHTKRVSSTLGLLHLLFPEPETFHHQLPLELALLYPSGLWSDVISSEQPGPTLLSSLPFRHRALSPKYYHQLT